MELTSARDLYHDNVRSALIKVGWTITHDPYTITFGQKDVFSDLEDLAVALISFDPKEKEIITWTP